MFRLTDRQSAGLANMEAFVGIRRPRTEFSNREAFQEYWDLVAKRGDAAKRIRATETPATRAAQRQRRQERVTAYYQQAEHLLAYGRTYAQRYQPSAVKLRQQLLRKSGDAALSEQIMERLAGQFDDEVRARELAEIMQRQGRHAQAIRLRLRLKLFAPDTIERCLRALSDDSGTVLELGAISRKVLRLQRKGLSQRAMRTRLMGQASDGPVVQAALTQMLGDHGDDRALEAAIAKLSRKRLEPRALIQRLVSKGFRYAEIVHKLAMLEQTTM